MTKAKPFLQTVSNRRPRKYVVYELLDPSGLPVLCSYGESPSPWLSWWLIREHLPDETDMGKWLRYLDRPPPRGWFFMGGLTPISRAAAEGLAKHRIAELREEIGCELPYNRVPGQGPRPLIRVWPDGRTERYASVSDAARKLSLSRRQVLRHVDTGEPIAMTGGILVAA